MSAVIEPPLSIANSLLAETMRLADSFDEAGGLATWVPPEHYGAVVVVALSKPGCDGAPMRTCLEKAANRTDEFPVRLSQLRIESDNDREALVVSDVLCDGEEIEGLSGLIVEELENVGFQLERAPRIRIPVAGVNGEKQIKMMREAIADKDAQIAGWLLGGFCLSRIIIDDEAGFPGIVRIAFIPLKRKGSRRR